MKRNHSTLWVAGWTALASGCLLAVLGAVATDELAQLAGGYGLMLMGASLYLIGGLGLRETLMRRSQPAQSAPRPHAAVSTFTATGNRP